MSTDVMSTELSPIESSSESPDGASSDFSSPITHAKIVMSTKRLHNILSLNSTEFDAFMAQACYKTLKKLQKASSKDDKWKEKNLSINRVLRTRIKEGYKITRRKPGSGQRVEITKTYIDSAMNRKLNRVGQNYTTVSYENPEYIETLPREKTKKRRRSNNLKKNCWIEAVCEAKLQLNAPSWVVIRKVVDNPCDEQQILGHKVYTTAMEILSEKKKTPSSST